MGQLEFVNPFNFFYQPQTPAIAMIKAKKMITEAANHFLIFIIFSF
jgi:hypothetical protein